MAATATERKLFVGGDWVETGDWFEVRSPYSGDVVGRVAKGGAAETKRAGGRSVLGSGALHPASASDASSARARGQEHE